MLPCGFGGAAVIICNGSIMSVLPNNCARFSICWVASHHVFGANQLECGQYLDCMEGIYIQNGNCGWLSADVAVVFRRSVT
jgi:hypothetical protein